MACVHHPDVEKVDDVPYLPGVSYDPYPRVLDWLKQRRHQELLALLKRCIEDRRGVYFRLPLDSYESYLTIGTEREAYTFCVLIPSDRRKAELYVESLILSRRSAS